MTVPSMDDDLESAKDLIRELKAYFAPGNQDSGFDVSPEDLGLLERLVKRVEIAEAAHGAFCAFDWRGKLREAGKYIDTAYKARIDALVAQIETLKIENARLEKQIQGGMAERDNLRLQLLDAKLDLEEALNRYSSSGPLEKDPACDCDKCDPPNLESSEEKP